MPATERQLEFILYSRANCGLCDRLEAMLEPHLRSWRPDTAVNLTKRDITENPQWHKRYKTRIPVLTCGSRIILEGRPEADQVVRALAQLQKSMTRSPTTRPPCKSMP